MLFRSFIEEEVAEAMLDVLGWRAQGRARRPVQVRGGVLADQVGYGKTAITLGLIDCAPGVKLPKEKSKGYISVKGTLVVVPPHLTRQWGSEVIKFTGKDHFSIVIIQTASQINSLSIQDVIDADIVVVASSLFHGDVYQRNLESFAASDDLPAQDGRFFNVKLEETLVSLQAQVERLKTEGASAVLKEVLAANKRSKSFKYMSTALY